MIAEFIANSRQYRAPIVLGIISEKIRIASVRIAEITPKYASPKIMEACAPTPAAPIVCAIVFKDKIAERGLSILLLRFRKVVARLDPSSSLTFKNVSEEESKTDSIIEHKKDTNKARKR
jgi:hypothetical protein